MANMLKGKNAVVTGSGRGVGRAIVMALAAEGVNVIVNDLGGAANGTGAAASAADEVVAEIKELGGTAVANYESVSSWDSAEKIIRSCIDNFGRIDILVNVAGILRDRMAFNMSDEDWSSVLAVHLSGTFYCTRHAIPFMREQQSGRIINTSSGAWLGSLGQVNYSAAKGGIISLTYSIASEMARYNVTCNAICPVAATRMTMSDELKAAWKKKLESGQITREYYESMIDVPPPEGVAPLIAFLASDNAAHISGTVFRSQAGAISMYTKPALEKELYIDYKKNGIITPEELVNILPKTVLSGYIRPVAKK